jgi:hypothetical protein
MGANRPLWLRAVLRLERAVGTRVESAVRGDAYFDVMSDVSRASRTVKRTAEGLSRRGLHLLNLPAGSDVRGMREQLSRMERRLSRLTEDVAEIEDSRHRPGVR